jgi:CDP-6-deoxy-D-xylo-4-hexulose-3-dehydrase
MKVPLSSNGLREKDIEAAIKVLKGGMLTMGSNVLEFEKMMADYLHVEHFIMVNSGSSANLAIIEALLRPTSSKPYLKQNDGVLVPAIAWPTTIWPLIQLGLKPCFVDITFETLAIDFDKAQELVDKNKNLIKAIFPIHPLGYGINSHELENFAKKNNLILINDVCESLGSWQSDKHSGTSGVAGSFSFYFSHHITTMEGGGVATNISEFADDIRSIRSHGWSRNRNDSESWTKSFSSNDSRFLFVSTGYNIRPMEIQAAIGISQLEDISLFLSKRRTNASKVGDLLKGSGLKLIGHETLLSDEKQFQHSWMMLPIYVGNEFQKTKDDVVNFLNSYGIETRPVLTGNFLKQPSMERIAKGGYFVSDTHASDLISKNAFLIGNHQDYSIEQVKLVLDTLQLLIK